MSRVNPIDLLFFLMESESRPLHMAAYQVFRIPDDYEGSFVHDLVAAYRHNPSVDPFNRVVKNLNIGIPRWESVEPDPEYHVRHLALPAPVVMPPAIGALNAGCASIAPQSSRGNRRGLLGDGGFRRRSPRSGR